MMLQSTLIATLLATTAAEISSTSKAGSKLMSKARALNQNNEDDYSWMASYDLKFDGCHSIHSYNDENKNDEDGSSAFGVEHLAKFKLCNSEKSCGSCANAGVYMVPLREFAETWLEAEKEAKEYACETVEANCACDNNYYDDSVCLATCYAAAGLTYCGQEEDEFDAAEYLECAEVNFDNYYGYGAFYIGPICSHSGKTVNLAVFTDAQCTVKAPSNTYETYNYGYKLPYSSEAMIGSSCVSCKKQDDNNNNNNNNNAYGYNQYYEAPEASETCLELYEESAKCETKMTNKNKYTRDTGSCEYIHKIVPALENVYHKKSGSGAATGFAVFFALTTIGALGAAYFFHAKVERSTVNLAEKEGGNFA